jgi:hypothetical protein
MNMKMINTYFNKVPQQHACLKDSQLLLKFSAGLLKSALTLVNRNVAHEANAEKIGAVNTHTVSTDKGMLIFCANLTSTVPTQVLNSDHQRC